MDLGGQVAGDRHGEIPVVHVGQEECLQPVDVAFRHPREELPPPFHERRHLVGGHPNAALKDARFADADRLHRQIGIAADRLDRRFNPLQTAEQPVGVDQLQQFRRGDLVIVSDLGDSSAVQLLHLAQQGDAEFRLPRIGHVPEQDAGMVAVAADPGVDDGEVIRRDQRQLLLLLDLSGHLAAADADVGGDDEHPQLVGHVVEHRWRVVAVVFYDADVAVSQVHQLAGQPLAFVHVGDGVIAPRHQLPPVQQQAVAVRPHLPEAEAGHRPVRRPVRRPDLHLHIGRPACAERRFQEVQHRLAKRRSAPQDGRFPVRFDAHHLLAAGRHTDLLLGHVQLYPSTASHLQSQQALDLLCGLVADRCLHGEGPLPHRSHDIHVVDAQERLEDEPHVLLHADGRGAGIPETRVQRSFGALAEFLDAGVGVAPAAVVGVDDERVLPAWLDRLCQRETPWRAQGVVLAEHLPVEVGAPVVAHPPQIEADVTFAGLPRRRHAKRSPVPTGRRRIGLELARAVRHPHSFPAARGRVGVVLSLRELPLAIQQHPAADALVFPRHAHGLDLPAWNQVSSVFPVSTAIRPVALCR